MLSRRDILGLALTGAVSLPALRVMAAATPAIGALKPGEYIWHPHASPTGPVVAIVSLPEQLMHVYRNGIEIGITTCSTGRKGHATPTGVFTILQKNEEHYSNKYNNAPMPFMQRLTWSGVAIHAGHLPGYPASHGCVRVPIEFSKLLFEVTHVGSTVIIADKATAPSEVLQPGLFLPAAVAETAAQQAKASAAKKGPMGPPTKEQMAASILVSAADRKGYLFRGGKLEHAEAVRIRQPGKPLGDHVYSFLGIAPDGWNIRWVAFGLYSQETDGMVVTRRNDETLGRIEVEDRSRILQIASTLAPGTTMVVTDHAASPETRTGPDFVVMRADGEDKSQKPKAGRDAAKSGSWTATVTRKP